MSDVESQYCQLQKEEVVCQAEEQALKTAQVNLVIYIACWHDYNVINTEMQILAVNKELSRQKVELEHLAEEGKIECLLK